MSKNIRFLINGLRLCLITGFLFGCASTSDRVVEKPVFPPEPEEPRFYYERTIRSSADVEKESEEASFQRLLTGARRTGDGLAKPFGVAVHKGRVFVSDTVRRSVMVFDFPMSKFFEIGTKDPGALKKPMGVAVDNAGNLYVCDATEKHVVVYDRDGKYLKTIGEADMFSRPAGLAVDKDGKNLYVVDTGGVSSEKHNIMVFDTKTGKLLRTISKRGVEEGELNLPREVEIGKNGNIYVVDGGNFRVQVFDKEGKFLSTFGAIGRLAGQFSRPKGIGIDPAGNIYVSDTAFGNFQIFTPEGQLLLAVGSRSSKGGLAKYMLPSGLTVDEDGRIYMVDQYYRKVDVFRPAALAENQGYLSEKPEVKK